MKTNIPLSRHVRNRLGLNKARRAVASRPQITARPVRAISFPYSPSSLSSPHQRIPLLDSQPCHGKTTKTLDCMFTILCANAGPEVHAAYLLLLVSCGPSKHMLEEGDPIIRVLLYRTKITVFEAKLIYKRE